MSRGGQEPPLVWTVGCSGIKDDIRERGLEVRSWRSIDAMLHAEHGVNRLRTVVLHDESLGNRTLPSTVRAIRSRFPLVDVLLWAPGARAPRVREALQGGIHDVILGRSSSRLADMVA
ncbi:MAG: hypothetical protein KC729_09460, partial [Candidatus Eisenbacteria bacterium]|nr:hypothetical protein [Candidatus Eisenbacteria bacterium]